MRRIRTSMLLVAVASLGRAGQASAWGKDGHRIVCQIAHDFLDPADQDKVAELIGTYRTPAGQRYSAFPAACLFADVAREKADPEHPTPGWEYFTRFNNWHFLNLPRWDREVGQQHCHEGDCVLAGIEHHSRRLANPELAPWKRAEALFFLGHWVGDVHQPLHVSYKEDRGGNRIPVTGGYYVSGQYAIRDLHAVWDTGIITRARGNLSWSTYARRLRERITPELRAGWLASTPVEWAQESYALTTVDAADYCKWENDDEGASCRPEGHVRRLDASYQAEFQDDVETRLQQAGVRLAERIRLALHPQ